MAAIVNGSWRFGIAIGHSVGSCIRDSGRVAWRHNEKQCVGVL